MEKNTPAPPPYLRGTFYWDRLDFQFAAPPPADLLSAAALGSSDPWTVLASTLAHAREGSIEPVRDLRRLFYAYHPTSLITTAALDLVGAAGSPEDLVLLEEAMREGSAALAKEACRAACSAGTLSLVPPMLAAWQRTGGGDRAAISLRLGVLLEDWDGEIADGTTSSEGDYMLLVRERFSTLANQLDTEAAPVLLGRCFSVRGLAEYMYEMVTAEDVDPALIRPPFYFFRHRFESATGIDCSSFFEDQRLHLLRAAAILDEFLAGDCSGHFEDGFRYFYGRRLPSS